MLPEERILAVFEGRLPDIMPWFADLTYWYHAQVIKGTLPEKYKGDKGRLRLYKELGCGAHEELYGPVVTIKYKEIKVRTYTEKLPDGELRKTVYDTPLGTLKKIAKYSSKSYSTATIKYPIETVRDLKVLKVIYEDMDIKPNYKAYERQIELMELWRGWGIVSSLPPRTPFIRLIIEWAGVITTFKLYWRFREELDEIIQLMKEKDDIIYEAIREAPARFVYFGENLSSDIISPKIFREYFFDYYRKRAQELHSAKKLIYVHIDGRLRGLLSLIAATGVDCAQSLTPHPVGDLPLESFRKEAGPDIILWGGLPGVYFSKVYDESSLLKTLHKLIESYRSDGKFIVGVADQVPPDGDINRVKKVSEVIEEYGKLCGTNC